MSILNKLINIQSELKAPKGQYNSFGKYKYRSCEDIFEAVKPLLKKENLALTISDKLVLIGERYYVKATAKLADDKESMEISAYAREEENKKGQDGSQITGASSSYARKYALNGLFLIDDAKDSDATNHHGSGTTNDDIMKLFEVAGQAGYSKDTIFKQIESKYHKKTPDLLTKAELNQLMTGYKKLAKLKDGEANEKK